MYENYKKTVFTTVAFQATAAGGGTSQNVPLGTASVEIRPQGAVTVKIDDSSVEVDLTANVWNPAIKFEPDGVTQHSVTLTGSTIECHLLCHVDTEICPTLTV